MPAYAYSSRCLSPSLRSIVRYRLEHENIKIRIRKRARNILFIKQKSMKKQDNEFLD